jgi:hypothetical protein
MFSVRHKFAQGWELMYFVWYAARDFLLIAFTFTLPLHVCVSIEVGLAIAELIYKNPFSPEHELQDLLPLYQTAWIVLITFTAHNYPSKECGRGVETKKEVNMKALFCE